MRLIIKTKTYLIFLERIKFVEFIHVRCVIRNKNNLPVDNICSTPNKQKCISRFYQLKNHLEFFKYI